MSVVSERCTLRTAEQGLHSHQLSDAVGSTSLFCLFHCGVKRCATGLWPLPTARHEHHTRHERTRGGWELTGRSRTSHLLKRWRAAAKLSP